MLLRQVGYLDRRLKYRTDLTGQPTDLGTKRLEQCVASVGKVYEVFHLQQNIRHAIVYHLEARYVCPVDDVRRPWERSRQLSRWSGQEGSHGEVDRDVVNGLGALARSRKLKSRNRRSLACACRSIGGQGLWFNTVETVTS